MSNLKNIGLFFMAFFAFASFGKDVPVEDIIVCDGSDNSIKIYRGSDVVWKWTAKKDKTFSAKEHSGLRNRFRGLTEARVCNYKSRKVVAIASTDCTWAIVDLATTNAIAYGYSITPGQKPSYTVMPHSIEILPNDIVAVASTYTIDNNKPERKKGVYFYHIAGDKATKYKDASQCGTFFSMDNPHGFYWDGKKERLYVSSSTGLHRMKVSFDNKENKFNIEEEKVFPIAPLGIKWGHDLALVPGTRKLVMTTYELAISFDMDKEVWVLGEIVMRKDIKGFDPHRDKKHILAAVPKPIKGCAKSWVTDTLEIYTREDGFKKYLHIPKAQIYKARWAGGVLDK